jgi:hypothetical protein
MEEYTPTTADIMECYKGQLIQTGEHSYELIEKDKAIAEFGRWIKAERTRVADMAIERERNKIIKMFNKFADVDGYVNMKVSDITKLISGENNLPKQLKIDDELNNANEWEQEWKEKQDLLNDFSWR